MSHNVILPKYFETSQVLYFSIEADHSFYRESVTDGHIQKLIMRVRTGSKREIPKIIKGK